MILQSAIVAIGWVCPVCGQGVAPHMVTCPCKLDAAEKVQWALTNGGGANEEAFNTAEHPSKAVEEMWREQHRYQAERIDRLVCELEGMKASKCV